eukprot:TRINITY_DN10262_c0_g1_i1.p3 TRINITY_DN10262_c0_g1~~TRINITY_DN10262_c0_g1_i1.p3  ORF type:complete len:186 (-),score=4.96 TRINITY_DN10262_c0_g1_i1:332-889(-)
MLEKDSKTCPKMCTSVSKDNQSTSTGQQHPGNSADVPHVMYSPTNSQVFPIIETCEQIQKRLEVCVTSQGVHGAVAFLQGLYSATIGTCLGGISCVSSTKPNSDSDSNQSDSDYLLNFIALQRAINLITDFTEGDVHLIFRVLDMECTGYVCVNEFKDWLLGPLDEARLRSVYQAYQSIEYLYSP